eukprot:XP_001708685.1 Hypothetical protein GL50803_34830 [Giardia lamblia ATCC 50803]
MIANDGIQLCINHAHDRLEGKTNSSNHDSIVWVQERK